MTRVVVRPPRAADAAGMARAWADAGRYYAGLDPAAFRVPDADGLVEFFTRTLDEPEAASACVRVAEVDGEVVGFVAARVEPADPDARYQLLRELAEPAVVTDALVVAAAARRRGAGAALMGAVHAWAAERGARAARVDTYVDSPLSVPFYEALGYRRRSLSFRRGLGDA